MGLFGHLGFVAAGRVGLSCGQDREDFGLPRLQVCFHVGIERVYAALSVPLDPVRDERRDLATIPGLEVVS